VSRASAWRKIAGWGGLVAVLAVAGWWACTVPYRPGKVYDAVPPNAVLVTRHLDVGARWGDVVRNPLAQSLLGTRALRCRMCWRRRRTRRRFRGCAS